MDWAAGIGMAVVRFPAYRGASELETLAAPLPTLSIDSEHWRIGREGAQLDIGGSQRWKLRLSASGSLPVNSDEIRRREGMPDLNPSLELGPALLYQRRLPGDITFNGELLLRSVFALDLHRIQSIGYVAQPRLSLHWETDGLQLRFASGPLWASRRYHGYFYDVAERFAAEDRPAFRTAAGYSGWRTQLLTSWRHKRLGVHGFVLWDGLSGADFMASPLVSQQSYLIAGLVLTWRLAEGSKH